MKSSSKKSAVKWLLGGFTALILTISLTGCSQSAEESPELEKTTDASLADTAEYVPASADGPAQNVPEPRLPVSATENSDDGAKATLEYFWEAEAFASLTGNGDSLAVVSDDSCAFCHESIDGWPKNYEDGYWSVLHGDIIVNVTEVVTSEEDDEEESVAHIYFELTEPATDFYNEEGKHLEASFDETDTQDWFAILNYDATAQIWKVEWLGLEDDVVWEE